MKRLSLGAAVALACFVVAASAVAGQRNATSLSARISSLEKGMAHERVLEILGKPDWAVLSSDSGDFAIANPPDLPTERQTEFALYWRNKNCTPVVVEFSKYFKVLGWDPGRHCGYTYELPQRYSCTKEDRTRYCGL